MPADDFFQAERLLAGGTADAAAAILERMLEENSEHVAGWRLYARALDMLGQGAEAADAARRADAIEADHTAEVGASLLFHGDERRAETCFERALALDPDCLSAHCLLGEFHGQRGARDKALAHYARCREIAPDRNGPAYMIAALGADASPDAAPRRATISRRSSTGTPIISTAT
jgi:tetratricopeptide (TPR) repeat protein